MVYCSDIFKKAGKVIVSGWVEDVRVFGGIKFIILRDRTGTVQVTLPKKEVKKSVFDLVESLTKESVITINGRMRESKAARSGKEIIPEDIIIDNISDQPVPLDISGKIESLLDSRLDWRFLDLRRPEVRAIFRVQSVISNSFRNYFFSKDFIEIQPPCIISAASEGGAELYDFKYFEKKAFLAQSPQLYKQMAIAAGFDRVFMTVPVWRAEPHATTRHLNESRQYDIEIAYCNDQQVLDYLEGVLKFIFKNVKADCKEELKLLKVNLKNPKFIRISYSEAVKQCIGEGIKIKDGEDLTPECERTLCIKNGIDNFLFVYNFPIAVRAFYSMPKDDKYCYGFDALYNGLEILSGATRIHKPDLLIRQLKAKNLNPKDFQFYIDAFRYGCPPHSGWSFGLERLTMRLLNLENIREAALFPRDRNRITP